MAVAVVVTMLSGRIAAVLAPDSIALEVARHLTGLIWIVPLLALSTVLGNLYMLPNGEDRLFTRIVLTSAMCGFLLVWTLPGRIGASGAVVAIVVAELVAASLMLYSYLGTRATHEL
jgi:Na+-driven multidrug efflux pump